MPESAGTLSVCVKIHAGEPSRDFSVTLLVNGQELSDLAFQTTGLTKQCTDVSIVDDSVVEYDETLTLELTSSDEGYLTLLPSTAVINIADDDSENTDLTLELHLTNAQILNLELQTVF